MKSYTIAAGVIAAATFAASTASAATVSILPQNVTTVKVTADLDGLGLSGAPTGTAGVSFDDGSPIFAFNITGGTAMDDMLVIEHDGSGVQLSAGSVSAEVGNFVIDTAAGDVSGNVNGGATFVQLFTFGGVTDDGIILNISADLAGALNTVFGVDGLAGAQFGFANTAPVLDAPAAVPLPASLPLLLAGLGGAAMLRRRKQAA